MTPFIKKLPEKLEQGEWLAEGYRWGQRDGAAALARQVHAHLIAHGGLILALENLVAPYLSGTQEGGQK